MWSMAHALSKINPNPKRVEVYFLRPVELPSEPRFVWEKEDGQGRF